ncbi:MAG: hypothetical protein JJ926_08520 [Roseitalea sp.]|nr:hypothetical protein [Roseitalea sp.]MBO6951912.1 hypothetical protein [Rhizobiaceae bacterium]MBO6592242.1 hypothetical protein [Roseitalea sp.]MBO6598497.1 hypothetical protein [Roseitalea sp.]MBO6610943.1 hypothetical protein [Roseitalea sp.]
MSAAGCGSTRRGVTTPGRKSAVPAGAGLRLSAPNPPMMVSGSAQMNSFCTNAPNRIVAESRPGHETGARRDSWHDLVPQARGGRP